MGVILNDNFNNLPFEYDQRLIIRWPIDCSYTNILKRLIVILIGQSFENWKCGCNHQSAKFDDFPFYYDQRLITRQLIDSINDNIVERLKIVRSLTFIWNGCKSKKGLYRLIHRFIIESVHVIIKWLKLINYILYDIFT